MLDVVDVLADLLRIALVELLLEELESLFDLQACSFEEGSVLDTAVVSQVVLRDELSVDLESETPTSCMHSG